MSYLQKETAVHALVRHVEAIPNLRTVSCPSTSCEHGKRTGAWCTNGDNFLKDQPNLREYHTTLSYRTRWILIGTLRCPLIGIWAYLCCTVSSTHCWGRWWWWIHWRQKQTEACWAWFAPAPPSTPTSELLSPSPTSQETSVPSGDFSCWLLEAQNYVTFHLQRWS